MAWARYDARSFWQLVKRSKFRLAACRCLTTLISRQELFCLAQMTQSRIYITSPFFWDHFQDGMDVQWPDELICSLIKPFLQQWKIDIVS